MIKEDYKKELKLERLIREGDYSHDVERIQEWLTLWTFFDRNWYYKVEIDKDFGPLTRETVKLFQLHHDILDDGEVGPQTWSILTLPLQKAFSPIHAEYFELLLPHVCKMHLQSVPRELNNKNEGPWVRSYMGGHDGSPWAWCAGSAQTILDQVLSTMDKKFTDYMPLTYSCTKLAEAGIEKNVLLENSTIRKYSGTKIKDKIKAGDLFLIRKNHTVWSHVGIILEVHDDYFVTCEGNTNDEGSREGFEFCKRIRSFRKQNLDVYRLNKLLEN